MSYASVAASGAPPPSAQPQADPALWNTAEDSPASAPGPADDGAKVNVVTSDFKQNPVTFSSSFPEEPYSPDGSDGERVQDTSRKGKGKGKKRSGKLPTSKDQINSLLGEVKEQLFRPGVAGGLVGAVNVGLLTWASYYLYTRPHLRKDTELLSIGVGSAVFLLSAEGYAAGRYAETPRGREEKRRAEKEGAVLYRHAKETILRPGVLGGFVGLFNLGVISTIGYYSYANWHRPRWDRQVVSAVSVGLLTLWSGESYLAALYAQKH